MLFNENDTAQYYDEFGPVYPYFWTPQIHCGFFDGEKEKDLRAACEDMNRYLARLAGIQQGSKILTVGCGQGGADRFLAKEYGAHVLGVDLSETQLGTARTAASEASFSRIRYIKAPMTTLPCDDASMDIIWAQQSFFHCHDKTKAVQEFHRVLRDGGRIVLEETTLHNSTAREELLQVYGPRLKLNELLMAEELVTLFEQTNLQLEECIDLSQHLGETYRRINEGIEENRATLRAALPDRFSEGIDRNFGMPISLRFVQEGKLGCHALVFVKSNISDLRVLSMQ